MVNLDRLRKSISRLRDDASKAEGALAEKMAQLTKKFGVRTIKEAKSKLASLEEEEAELGAKLEAEVAEFEKKYGELLE